MHVSVNERIRVLHFTSLVYCYFVKEIMGEQELSTVASHKRFTELFKHSLIIPECVHLTKYLPERELLRAALNGFAYCALHLSAPCNHTIAKSLLFSWPRSGLLENGSSELLSSFSMSRIMKM